MAPSALGASGSVPSDCRPTVGLEIHARLLTETKLFCACANRYGARPNSLTCPVCLGLPGTLPVMNHDALALAVRAGLAFGCRIEPTSEFARKNYFYPDLPRNYQITQYEHPLCRGGELSVAHPEQADRRIRVRLERIHLEEDAGRSRHDSDTTVSVDLNRAGTPLIEIVTRPDLSSGAEARVWLKRLRQSLQYLGVCDGNMAEGSLRCDANVGLATSPSEAEPAPDAATLRPAWSELKNLNSFRAVARGVDYEIARLRRHLAEGRDLRRETRSWNDARGRTEFLRRKESSADYRYFPEPDLPLLRLGSTAVTEQTSRLPELPADRERRFRDRYGLPTDDAAALCATIEMADYFEAVVSELGDDQAIPASNWLRTEVQGVLTAASKSLADLAIPPRRLAELLQLVADGNISGAGAKQVFAKMADLGPDGLPADIVHDMDLRQVSGDDDLRPWCRAVLAEHRHQVAAYRAGKTGLLDFLVGRVMALSSGKANPRRVRDLLQALIEAETDVE